MLSLLCLWLSLLFTLVYAQCPPDQVVDKTYQAKDLKSWAIVDGKLDADVKAEDDRLLFIISTDTKKPHIRSPDKFLYPTGAEELSVTVKLRFEEDQDAKVLINWMQDASDGVIPPVSVSLNTQGTILRDPDNMSDEPDCTTRAISSTVNDCKESCSTFNRDDLTDMKTGDQLMEIKGDAYGLTGNFKKEDDSFFVSGSDSSPYTVSTLLKEKSVTVNGHKNDDEDELLLSYGYATEGRPTLQLDLGPSLNGGLLGSAQFLSILSVGIKGCRVLSQAEIDEANKQKEEEEAKKKQEEEDEAAALAASSTPEAPPEPATTANVVEETTGDELPEQTPEKAPPKVTSSSSSSLPPAKPTAVELTSLISGVSTITSQFPEQQKDDKEPGGKVLTVIATTEVVDESYIASNEYESSGQALIILCTIVKSTVLLLLSIAVI